MRAVNDKGKLLGAPLTVLSEVFCCLLKDTQMANVKVMGLANLPWSSCSISL